MNTSSQKRIAAQVLKCGTSRVRLKDSQEVEDALTRQDVRDLVQKGEIYKEQKKGTSRFAARRRLSQKKKGRMRGMGKRKGTAGARKDSKTKWIESIRAQRSLIRELRDNGKIEVPVYRMLYTRVKGGFFRNRSHLMMYLKEHEMLKGMKPEAPKAASKATTKKEVKKAAETGKKAKQAKPAKKPAVKKGPKKAAVKKAAPKKTVPKKARARKK